METNIQYLLPIAINVARYFLFAGIPFLIFYLLFPDKFSKNKIQVRFARRKDFLREILHSMQTTFILAGVSLLIIHSPLRNYTQIYDSISAYPIWWIPVSVLLGLIVHDTYFYWMHRTVHHPRLFRRIHLLHHKSVNPSPWASYSFHFFEGVLEAMVVPVILLLIPMHLSALILFTFSSFAINVYGHLGYEIAPKWFRHSPLFEIFNTSVYHNMHHAKFKGNYGLYFRFWDRLMNTEHPDYVKEYDEIQQRRFGDANPSYSWKITLMILVFIMGLGAISAIGQSSIEGKWKDDEDGGVILIYEEDGLYYGQLVAADKPEENAKIQGKTIVLMKDFQKTSDGQFCCGTIYQPREKRVISATLILKDDDALEINGRYGIFTGRRIWTRL